MALVAVALVAVARLAAVVVPIVVTFELIRDRGQHIEAAVSRFLGDRLIKGGLEARDVHDEVCLADERDILRSEFEIVRLGTRRGEVDHLDCRSAHLLSGVLQGIEGRDDLQRRRGRRGLGRGRRRTRGRGSRRRSRRRGSRTGATSARCQEDGGAAQG